MYIMFKYIKNLEIFYIYFISYKNHWMIVIKITHTHARMYARTHARTIYVCTEKEKKR